MKSELLYLARTLFSEGTIVIAVKETMDGINDDGNISSFEAERISEVERYFDDGGDVSVNGLRAFLAARPRLAVDEALYLHCACAHAGVTPALVAFLLAAFPGAAHAPAAAGTGLAPAGGRDAGPYPLHVACANARCPAAVLRALLERNPAAAETACEGRQDYEDFASLSELVKGYDEYFCCKGLPLHYYLSRGSGIEVTMASVLVEAYPAALTNEDDYSPLDVLLLNSHVDDFFDTVQLLLERTSAQGEVRRSPLHVACINNHVSLRIVKLLVDRWPESTNEEGGFEHGPHQGLPIHLLCTDTSSHGERGAGLVDVLEHLIEASPASLRHWDMGYLPIHYAVASWQDAEFAKVLIRRDPAGISKTTADTACTASSLPLHLAAVEPDSGLGLIQLLFDAHPEGIWTNDAEGNTPPQLARRGGSEQIVTFLDSQMVYARLAQDTTAMTTPDTTGRLPLHRALCDGASSGAIKLLVNGNPDALKHCDSFENYPLHHACHGASLEAIKLLANGNPAALKHCNSVGDYPLHHACQGCNYAVVKYLLDGQGAMALELNDERKLPIQLLCHSGTDNKSPEHVEAIWQLLLTCPEVVSRGTSHGGSKMTDKDGSDLLARPGSSKAKGGDLHKKPRFTKHSCAKILLQLRGTV